MMEFKPSDFDGLVKVGNDRLVACDLEPSLGNEIYGAVAEIANAKLKQIKAEWLEELKKDASRVSGRKTDCDCSIGSMMLGGCPHK